MEKGLPFNTKWIRNGLIALFLAVICVWFWPQVQLTIQLILGGWIIAFLLEPLTGRFSAHMNRALAVTCAYGVVGAVLVGAVLLFIPPMTRQIRDLIAGIPGSIGFLDGFIDRINGWLSENSLMQLNIPDIDLSALSGGLEKVMSGTVSFAGSMVDGVGRFGLMLMLAFYFLLDRERLLLRVELLIPSAARRLVLRMAGGTKRELRIYLRGQMTIALIVGALAAIGLAIVGVKSYLVLGLIVGALNMIPYFGPILGGIPAVLMALGQSLPTAMWTLVVLFIVQQLDGFIISPRVMSGMTGLSPPAVLIAITVGGSTMGILGMLFALPILLIEKICLRVWITRNEMIEKTAEV